MGALTHNGEVLQRLPANASQINFDKTGTNLNSTQTEAAIKEVNTKANTNADDITQLKSGLITLHGYTDISASVVDPSLSFTATENCILWLRSSNAENVAPYYNYLVNNTKHGLKGGVGATLDHYVFLRAGDVFKFNDTFPYESTLTNNVYLV